MSEIPLQDHRIQIDTVYGPMVINRHDTIRGRCLIETGMANDHPEIELLVKRLKARAPHGNGVAIDVGANFGCFALAFAPHCDRVLAIEAQRDLCEMLHSGIKAWRVANVAVTCEAAGRERAWLTVPDIDYGQPQDFGSVKLVHGMSQSGLGVIVRPLDETIAFWGFTRVDLIKIDVEGMEMDVLEGATATIDKFKPILYVEHLHSDRQALVSWIKARGYKYVREVGINLLADPSEVRVPITIVSWPDEPSILAAAPTWSDVEKAEWDRIADVCERLTTIEELGVADNTLLELIQCRIGRSLAERCPHGILLWLDCGHCKTHVAGDLPTLLSPAALATMEKLAAAAPDGCFIEVGVFRGGSAQRLYRIAERQSRAVYLYDTFGPGIPEKSAVDWIPEGHFAVAADDLARMHAAMPLAQLVQGVFPDVALIPERIAFAHVDCDQYVSYKKTLRVLWPRLVSGGIILCDDYDALHGAQLAIREMAFQFGLPWKQLELTPEGKAVLRKP